MCLRLRARSAGWKLQPCPLHCHLTASISAHSQCGPQKFNFDPIQLTCLAESRVQRSHCYRINLTLWEMKGMWGGNQSVILY